MAGWTKTDLAKLEEAILQGGATLRVKFSDREITYRSLDEMIRLRDLIRSELGEKSTRPVLRPTQFSRDLG